MSLRYPPLLDLCPATVAARVAELAMALELSPRAGESGGGDGDGGSGHGGCGGGASASGRLERLYDALVRCPSWLGQAPGTVAAKISSTARHLDALLHAVRNSCDDTRSDDDACSGDSGGESGGDDSCVSAEEPRHGADSDSGGPSMEALDRAGGIRGGVSGEARRRACKLLLSFPGLLAVSESKLQSKFALLADLAAARPAWGAELASMSPSSLGRCLAASHVVLGRLRFFLDSKTEPTGPSGGAIGLLKLVIMSASQFKVRHACAGRGVKQAGMRKPRQGTERWLPSGCLSSQP
eukprot:78823-Chlamydomonas_euryale.AAC.5